MTMKQSIPIKPLVSVMIISYNQEHFIREAVESALLQAYDNLEVVVSDDASKDATPAILKELAQRYPQRLRLILNPVNHGITANSNIGLQHCSGEFIAFMGGDDLLLPGKIEAQMAWFAEDERRVLCGHDVEWVDARGGLLNMRTSDRIPLRAGFGASGFIRYGSLYAATSVMVRRSRIPAYGFHPALPVVSDWKLWLDVIEKDGAYGFVPGIHAHYRRHDNNITLRPNWPVTRDVFMTAWLSLWHFHGCYMMNWAYYFIFGLVRRRLQRLFARRRFSE